jgi:hypothetical protein
MAATEHAQREPESGGGFAFARPRMDDEKTLLDRLSGDLCVLHEFTLRHLRAMTLDLMLVDWAAHASPFMVLW